jgi:hypothetical protein
MFIKNMTRRCVVAADAKLCNSLLSRAKGMMFSQRSKDKALILSFPAEQKIELHMFFVFFPIDVMFLNERKRVVELKKKFLPFTTYSSSKKTKYAVELPQGTIEKTRTRIGDRIEFFDVVKRKTEKRLA